MATTIQVKRSTSVTDAEMASNTLAYGELAYSFHATTNKLWIGNNTNAPTTIGCSYFTELFNSDTTAGTNTTGKILISNSTDGSLDFSAKNLTNVGAFDANSIVVGNTGKTATIVNSGDILGIITAVGIDLTLGTDSAMTLNAASIQGSTIKDQDEPKLSYVLLFVCCNSYFSFVSRYGQRNWPFDRFFWDIDKSLHND